MSDKQQRDMQEALDASLDPKAFADLMRDVEADRETAQTYRKLQSAESQLQQASTQSARVPNRMADSIMARIAQAESLPEPQTDKNQRALAWGLGLSAALVFPLLLGLSITILTIFGTTSALSGVALGVIGLALYLYTSLNALVATAGTWVAQFSFLFAALLLIPLAIVGLRRFGTCNTGEQA